MIKIILGFVLLFALIFGGYKYFTGMDDVELERFVNRAPTVLLCILATIAAATFIIVSF